MAVEPPPLYHPPFLYIASDGDNRNEPSVLTLQTMERTDPPLMPLLSDDDDVGTGGFRLKMKPPEGDYSAVF